jgi:hypothetical protein
MLHVQFFVGLLIGMSIMAVQVSQRLLKAGTTP